jgi:hypothetical protein
LIRAISFLLSLCVWVTHVFPHPFCPGCGPPLSHWLPCTHPILTPFPTSPAKVLPCPACSHISVRVLRHSSLITLMMEATSTSETSVNFYQITQCNNPEDSHLHTHHHENLELELEFIYIP